MIKGCRTTKWLFLFFCRSLRRFSRNAEFEAVWLLSNLNRGCSTVTRLETLAFEVVCPSAVRLIFLALDVVCLLTVGLDILALKVVCLPAVFEILALVVVRLSATSDLKY